MQMPSGKESKKERQFSNEQVEVLRSIRTSRIILPILIGVGVVLYMLWRKYDPNDFAQIEWNQHTIFWVLASISFLIVRHIAYALRLRILSDKEFSWRKCIELIFIWEFSSAVSPTSVGGSAVALFVLSQEKLSAAKTATIVIYSAVLDTLFFVSTLFMLYLIFGSDMIRPATADQLTASGWEYAFLVAYLFMLVYGAIFFYGIFVNTQSVRWLLDKATNIRWLRKYKEKATLLGTEMAIASKEMRKKSWSYHLVAFISTATAWSCRFILLGCLVLAVKPGLV
ncbi:MAG TPA: flippase-like domain-containing protein, partial [Phaeodactylibacter sp.]|nr:flippase-like domain-containing protein [Phaeodactylibacter sp.]